MKLALAILCLTAFTASAFDWRASRAKELSRTQHRLGIRGGLIEIEKRPYVVSLHNKENIRDVYYGPGVLINRDWVLSAAINSLHFNTSTSTVRVGSKDAMKGGKSMKLSKIVVHPNYTITWANDLVLLKLSEPVEISKNVTPIALASTLPNPGANTILTGYGYIYDRGAPLIYRNELIGIYSGSGDICDSLRLPGVYSDVIQFKKWIKDTIST